MMSHLQRIRFCVRKILTSLLGIMRKLKTSAEADPVSHRPTKKLKTRSEPGREICTKDFRDCQGKKEILTQKIPFSGSL